MPAFSVPPLTIDIVVDDIAIETATRSALRLADSRGLTSIAVPAFGTGVGGFPVERVAHEMIDGAHA